MNNLWKRMLCLTLSILMTVQLLPLSVLAQEAAEAPIEAVSEPEAQSTGPVVTEDNLTAILVDAETGEESWPAFDLADKASWRTFKVIPAVYEKDDPVPITSGTTEFFWCYSIGHEGIDAGPIGMMPGKWGEQIEKHRENYPDDWQNTWLVNGMDGWTTDPAVPTPLTAGELLGTDAAFYLNNYSLVLYLRHTTDDGEQILSPNPIIFNENRMENTAGLQGYLIPTDYPHTVGAVPLNWGLSDAGMPMSLRNGEAEAAVLQNDVIVGDDIVINPTPEGGPLTVYANIEEYHTPVVYFPHACSLADGMVGPGAYCGAWGLENGNCGCYSYLWVTVPDGTNTAPATPADFVPVGFTQEEWQQLCSDYAQENPEAWGSGDYSGLYESEALEYIWSWGNRLPLCSEANIADRENYDHSDVLSDYATHTYACVIRWEFWESIYDDENDQYIDNVYKLYGYGDPVTIIPDDGTNIPDDSINPDIPADKHKPASPLPESDIKGLEWFAGFQLNCDASYGRQELTYQWYRSLTNDYNGIPLDPNVENGADTAAYQAQYPERDDPDTTYYYYCEYSFVNDLGETETHRTTICALRRAKCSMLEIKVSPGAFYLEPDPSNTDYYSPEYIRYSNATLDVSDPDDYTLPYAYQVYGGESVLSAWIEPEDLFSSDGFLHSDYITWQWYRSDTEDWTTGTKVGNEGRVEGLTEISLSKPLVSGTMSLINFNAFNKHANIHVDCPTDTLDPFYMTIVITNHYTDSQGNQVTSTSTGRCKVFTFEKNEDLYSVDETGMLNGYNGHESVWNIPAEIDGVKVTSIGIMAQTVAPLPPSSDKSHYSGPTKIVIPEGVTEICDRAFFRLYSLEEVELPSTLKRIGKHAFCDSGAIKSMTLPASVEEIGGGAFYLSRIREFIFNDDVWPLIGGSAFTQSYLRKVVFPANATGVLNGDTFYDSQNLSAVINWHNIENLDRDEDFKFTPAYEYLVEGSGGLSDGNFIYLPDEEGTGWMVAQCVLESPESIEIPAYFQGKPVTTVGRGKSLLPVAASAPIQLVGDVLALRHVILPETVHTINEQAFDGCENLETVTFHSNIKLVKKSAFQDCYRLTSTVTLASGAQILDSAFYDCRNITRLDAPGAYIAGNAFRYCFSLEHITLYEPLLPEYNYTTYQGGYMYFPFAYTKTYTDARDVVLYYRAPDSEPDEELAKKHPGRRYGNIFYKVDENDPSLGTIELYGGADDYQVTLPGMVPSGNDYVYLTNVRYSVFDHMTTEYHDVVFEDGISVLEYYSGSTSWRHPRMRNVTLAQSVTELNNFFQGGYGGTGLLESINIPAGVIILEEEAFTNNPKLHTVTFDDGSQLGVIQKSVFRGSAALKNADLSNLPELTQIDDSAFSGCDLPGVDLTGSPKLKRIGAYAFAEMSDLQYIRLPDNLEDIGIYAFKDSACNNRDDVEYHEVVASLDPLKELILPANLKKIGKGAFQGQFMDNTANAPFVLELPETLEWIGNEAFGGYMTTKYVDMELWSNVVLKDGKLPASLKIFGNYSTESFVDDNVGSTSGGPFALSVIDKLTFPAGIEILGQNACNRMPKLTTVVFEAEDQPTGNGSETVYTSSLRELHPGSLTCISESYYDCYDWDTLSNIEGFENLRKLEYLEDVFGATSGRWNYPEDSYTTPDTVRHLGRYALYAGSSPFKNISLSAGIQQIDNHALSNDVAKVGPYITALEMAPSNTTLADEWILPTAENPATLRCYTASAFHLWAEKQNYPFELMDPDSRVVYLELTENGKPIPHPEQWLETCQWKDADGNVVCNDYYFRNAQEGMTYTVTLELNSAKLQDYVLPIKTATVTLEPGSLYACLQLPVAMWDHITVKGVLPQVGLSRFDARIVQSRYPYSVIAYINPDPLTGEFSVELPKSDCKLVLTANDETPYVKTEYTNLLYSAPVKDGVIDLGSLPMELGPMFLIPIHEDVDLSRCSSLKVTDEEGNDYYAQLVYRYWSVEDIINDVKTPTLYIKNAIQAGVTIGDTLTLSSSVTSSTCEQVVPYSFKVPKHDPDFVLKPQVKNPVRIINKAGGYLYLYDGNGDLISSNIGWLQLEPGSYTAIGVSRNLPAATLQDFLDYQLAEGMYMRKDFTVSSGYGDNIVIDWKCPVIEGSAYGISMSYNAAYPDSNGNIPVYIVLNMSSLIPDGPVDLVLRTNKDTLPFIAVNGSLINGDQPDMVTNVQANSGGGLVRSSLSFTATAREGVLTLYAKPDGTNLNLFMGDERMVSLKLPEQGYNVTAPADIVTRASGVLTLFSRGKASDTAVVVVDGEEQAPVTLRHTGTGSNALPYTLKTYADGTSMHTLQVLVRNGAGEQVWESEIFTVMHTNQPAPEPQKLDIRITNMNATHQNGMSGNVDGVNTVENASLNFVTGEYKPMKFVVPCWYYNDDGTMQKEITFDYSLSVSHPELIHNGKIILKVFFREMDPYIEKATLVYNKTTGTFDGTLEIPGNTISITDLPYGVSLDYESEVTTEEVSPQYILDQANEEAELIHSFIGIEPEEQINFDLDYLRYWLETNDFTDEERDAILEIAALNNEMAELLADFQQDTYDTLSTIYGMEAGKDLLEQIQAYVTASGASASIMPLDEPMTPAELLDMGFKEFKFNGATIYSAVSAGSSRMVWLDPENPENSLMMICGNMRTFARSSDSQSDSGTRDAIIRNTLGLLSNVLGAMEVAVNDAIALMNTLSEKVSKQQAKLDELSAKTPVAARKWETYWEKFHNGQLMVQDMVSVTKIDQARTSLHNLQKQLENVKQAVSTSNFHVLKTSVAPLKPLATGLSKVLGNAVKVVPYLGTVLGCALLVYDLACLVNTAYDLDQVIDNQQNNYDEYNEMLNDYPKDCLDETQMRICRDQVERWSEKIRALDSCANTYLAEKLALLTLDVGTTIGSAVAGVGNVVALVAGLGSAGTCIAMDALFQKDWRAAMQELLNTIHGLSPACSNLYDCDDDDNPDPGDDPNKDPNGEDPQNDTPPQNKMDPSGYVYEAVASNRIQGATAQVFYRGTDGSEVFWSEAAAYDEINPQTTDVFGAYGWMTPPGNWLVKITKDGYLPADSKNDPEAVDGWLPVPPPQLNVNIPMISTVAPQLVFSGAAPDRVQLVFSQYMDIAQLTEHPELIAVTQDGESVPIAFSFSDSEESPTKAGTFYGRILNITRTDGAAFTGSNVRVTVDQAFGNYAATAMTSAFDSGAMNVKAIPGNIFHSYPNRMAVLAGDEITISAQVVDTQGQPMGGVSVELNATYGNILNLTGASTVISDANGIVNFPATALRPGTEYVVFSTVNGLKVQMEVRVDIVDTTIPAKPTANISDYQMVPEGTQLVLDCATDGAVIYYTTNNTCPCTDSPERKTYTGPITVTENTLFRIASWTEAGGYSERLNLRILVGEAAHVHSLVLVPAIPAICDTAGKESYYTCVCGGNFRDKDATNPIFDLASYGILPALGHNWDNGTVTTEPDCTTAGEMTFTCLNDASHTRTEAVDALGHALIHHDAQAPDCTEIGWDAYDTCSRCDYTTYVEIPAKGHDFDTGWNPGDRTGHWHDCRNCDEHDIPADHLPNIGAATEEEDKFCILCGFILEPKLNHVHTMVLTQKVIPTCEESGKESYYTCSGSCGKHFADEAGTQEILDLDIYGILPALGHRYEDGICGECGAEDPNYVPPTEPSVPTEPTPPTDAKPGRPGLGSILNTLFGKILDKLCKHSFTAVTTPPTCTLGGYTTHTCSKCGGWYRDSFTKALSHAWDEGVVKAEPGCETVGTKLYTCGNDRTHTRLEKIPALGHNYEDGVCTECGEAESTPSKPVKPGWNGFWDWITDRWNQSRCDHSYTSSVTAPACTVGGYTTHTCTECGIRYRDSFTKAVGHRFVDGICSVCGEQEDNHTPIEPVKPGRPGFCWFRDTVLIPRE